MPYTNPHPDISLAGAQLLFQQTYDDIAKNDTVGFLYRYLTTGTLETQPLIGTGSVLTDEARTGPKEHQDFSTVKKNLVHYPWYSAFKADARDQLYNLVTQININNFAAEAAKAYFWNKFMLVQAAIVGGASTTFTYRGRVIDNTAYDAKALFANDHSWGSSGSNDNLLTYTGTTDAQILADYNTALIAFRGFKNNRGEKLYPYDLPNVKYWVLASPAIGGYLRNFFFKTERAANGSTNPIYRAVEGIIDLPNQTGNVWYLYRDDGSENHRPVTVSDVGAVVQKALGPMFGGLESEESYDAGISKISWEWERGCCIGDPLSIVKLA